MNETSLVTNFPTSRQIWGIQLTSYSKQDNGVSLPIEIIFFTRDNPAIKNESCTMQYVKLTGFMNCSTVY